MTIDLAAYLDWPVQIDEHEIWCANPECKACPGNGTVGLGRDYGMTPRVLFAAIAKHDRGQE